MTRSDLKESRYINKSRITYGYAGGRLRGPVRSRLTSRQPFIRKVARFMCRSKIKGGLGVRPIVPVTKHCQVIYGSLWIVRCLVRPMMPI